MSSRMRRMIKALLDACRLDPASLDPNSSHEPLQQNLTLQRNDQRVSRFFRTGSVARYRDLFRRLMLSIAGLFHQAGPVPRDAIYFYGLTANQHAALAPVAEELRTRHYPVILDESAYELTRQHSVTRLVSYAVMLPFLPCLFYQFSKARGYKRQSFGWAWRRYWQIYGLYILYRRWLAKVQPRMVVVSNDHTRGPCTLVKAAKDASILTCYMQHACVTDKFPPLTTDYALLDGRDALNKYSAAGPSDAQVHLIGMPKFDPYVNQANRSSTASRIGLCLSFADDVSRFQSLLAQVASRFPELRLVCRPHPRMGTAITEPLAKHCDAYGIFWSDPGTQGSFEFLTNLDVLIAGVSAITLEAAMLNVTPINFALNDVDTDWYGFVDQGLCLQTDNIEQLAKWLGQLQRERPAIQQKAQYYCDTIGGPAFGNSSALAADILIQAAFAGPRSVS